MYNSMKVKNPDFLVYYHEYKDKIFNYFWYRIDFNRDLAEDLTSEVFVKALTHFDSFDATRSFQAWIYAIAKNHLLNYYRTAGREVELSWANDQCRDQLREVEIGLDLENIILTIRTLEPYHCEVLLLRFVDGFDNREIAQLLEKDEGAVRTQLSRALTTLREKLSNEKPYE